MKLIVGLGNPGPEYALTRHNFGWDAVGDWAEEAKADFQTKQRFNAELAEIRLDQKKIILAHPLTYMNLSGPAVRSLLEFYKLALTDVLIVHDEMDYPLGKVALCANSGPGGHNGVASVQAALGTKAVARLRLGIGRPPINVTADEYVLQTFSADEGVIRAGVLRQAGQVMSDWCGVRRGRRG